MDPIRHFEVRGFGLSGLIKDSPATRRDASMLSVADNVRIQDGALSTIPTPITAIDFGGRIPAWSQPFYLTDENGGHVVAFTNNTVVFFSATRQEYDITPADITTVDRLHGCQVNDIFVLTNGVDHPWQITQGQLLQNQQMEHLVNWPAEYRASVFEGLKGYCVAAGIRINETRQRSMVKWSHPLSPGDEAFFWDHTDPSLLAGENVLGVAGRDIEGLQPLRDNMIIYFDLAVWRMSIVGGDLVMGFARLFTDDGAVGKDAFTDYDGRAIVVGHRDIYECTTIP